MKPLCTIMVKYVLPVIRAGVVIKLAEADHLNQQEIAEKLGLTQSSVSRYLSGDRGIYTEWVSEIPEIEQLVMKLTKNVTQNGSKEEMIKDICVFCKLIRRKAPFCKTHKKVLNIDDCSLCLDG